MDQSHFRAARMPLVPPGSIECQVRDMTATVSADVPLRQLQAKLAESDQWLPIDGDEQQTIGTLVSTDSTGPLRLGYGAWRDLLLGAQFRNGRGELITAGGRTVKNVAGYDLTKFMVGQRGIFGNLVTITTRTYRRPVGGILMRHPPDPSLIGRLIPTSLRPQWAVLTADALLCGYLGDELALAFYRSALRGQSAQMTERPRDDDIRQRMELWRAQGPVVFRASVPPARLSEFVRRIEPVSWAADPAFGIVLGSLSSVEEAQPLCRTASELGGSVRIYDGPFGKPLELSTIPAQRQIIERLKVAFDPDHNLEPLPWRLS